jgi:hypothetical protein
MCVATFDFDFSTTVALTVFGVTPRSDRLWYWHFNTAECRSLSLLDAAQGELGSEAALSDEELIGVHLNS